MIHGADILCDIQLFAEFGGKIRCKACVSIGNDSAGYSEVWEDVFCVEGRNALTSNGLFTREKQRGLGAIVICDGENGIISF